MRLPTLAALLLALLAPPLAAQVPQGTVREGITIQSRTLGKPVRYTIYLPPGYEQSTRRYPVVYLLHGYTDDDTGWLQFGEANLLADDAIAQRRIPPMILVMPDADVSFYIDNHDGTTRYDEFFTQEFVPLIDREYRTRPEKAFRGVAGLSMGGYGSLVYGLRHPEMFAAVAAFSSAVFTDAETTGRPDRDWARTFAGLYGPNLQGEARLTPHYRRYSVLDLVREGDPAKLRSVRWYIDCGDDDFLYRGNDALHTLMRDREIPHEYRVRDGAHRWEYWRTGLIDGLAFIGESFHR